jgi:hypothetical protein
MCRTVQSRQLLQLRDERSVTLEVSYTRSSSGESRPCIAVEGLLGSAHILPSPVRARSLLLREFRASRTGFLAHRCTPSASILTTVETFALPRKFALADTELPGKPSSRLS